MNKLIYKTFTWPQNPDHFQQCYVREPVYTKTDAGETVFSGMGPKQLTITGSGAFFGDGAYENFTALLKIFEDAAVGGLTHPKWGTIPCFFTELELTEKPRANYVAYQFEFRGADADGKLPV